MHLDHPYYAASRVADYDRIAVQADLVRQARTSINPEGETGPGWGSRLMMSLGFTTPTIEHAGHAGV